MTKWFLLLVAVFSLASCDDIADDRSLVDEPRLLAVQADPPAIRGRSGFVRLRALAVDESGVGLPGERVSYRVCSPWKFVVDPDRDCPLAESLVVRDREVSASEILSFFPPPANFFPPTETQPDAIEEPVASSNLCPPPPALQVPVIAEYADGGKRLQTLKNIPVYASNVARNNPIIEAKADELGGGEYVIEIHLDIDTLDPECRDRARQPESVRVFSYATSGSFDAPSVDLVPGTESAERAQVYWSSEAKPARLFFIAIDGGGGVSWDTLTL